MRATAGIGSTILPIICSAMMEPVGTMEVSASTPPCSPTSFCFTSGQRYLAALQPGARGKSAEKTFLANIRNRLDSLVNRITVLRPAAHLLVASIIPMNVSSGGTLLNNDVKTYNSYIEKTL